MFKVIVALLKVLILLFLGSITLGLGICSIGVGGSMLLSSRLSAFSEIAPLILAGVALTAAFGIATRQVWRSLQDESKPNADVDSHENDAA